MDGIEETKCDLIWNFTHNSYKQKDEVMQKNTLAASSKINILYQSNVKTPLRVFANQLLGV